MKTIGTLVSHLAGETTTLTLCWRVTREDGQVFRFTAHDVDLLVGGYKYEAALGFSATAVETSSALNVDDMEVEGLLSSAGISTQDLMSGLWNNARVEMFMVNYKDTSQGPLNVRVGWLGEALHSAERGMFVIELRGPTQRLQQTIGRAVTAACDADFGDARCKVNKASYTITGAVTSVASNQVFDGDTTPVSAKGEITWTAGQNTGLSMEIKAISGSTFTLLLPMPYPVLPGDTYSAVAGCDKSDTACKGYNNYDNNRGFPHLSTVDKLTQGPQ